MTTNDGEDQPSFLGFVQPPPASPDLVSSGEPSGLGALESQFDIFGSADDSYGH